MRHLAIAATLLLAASTASAGFDYTRNTTVRDDLGGQFQLSAAGTLDRADGTHVAEGRFSAFHPRNEAATTLDGTITREALRDGELVTVTYDGTLSLASTTTSNGTPRSRTTSIAFTDLIVERAEEGVTVSGTVIVNGQPIAAADLPRPIKAILVRAVRLFRL